jgi:ATP-dependent helicase/nuclease subunit B
MRVGPNVFTIPPSAPFLPTLADALISGRLIEGFRPGADPLALADATIFLPTRRAARALSAALLARLGTSAAILPAIRPLGDMDDDFDAAEDAAEDELAVPLPIEPTERLLAMTRLVRQWTELVGAAALHPTGEAIRIPSSPADAVHLARGLLRLMDEAASAEVGWSGLSALVPDDYAGYWQLTLGFLSIATEHWPAYLAERGVVEPIERRNRRIARLAERLKAAPPAGPMIVAGSTGSVPATARLIAAIARLPNGAVVLPGLDQSLDEAGFAAIDADGDHAPSHPQYGLKRLLATIGIGRAEVISLGTEDEAAATRARIVSEAMRPAETTERWPAFRAELARTPERLTAALGGLKIIAARNEVEEALAIALALRETMETPGLTAALVTPDRTLARRVAAELQRFGLEVDDSAGRPLEGTETAVLARVAAEVALGGLEPEALAALLEHPLAAFGQPRSATRAAAVALELAMLRGPRLRPGSGALCEALAHEMAMRGTEEARFWPAAKTRLDEAQWLAAADLCRRVQAALRPLETLAAERECDAATLAAAHEAVLGAILDDGTGDAGAMTADSGGAELFDLFAGVIASARGIRLQPAAYDGFFRALLGGETVRRPAAGSARLAIWGPLEARLQRVDRLVLGGLNEAVWPAATRTDAWLSRPMRAGLELDPPERRIGLSAHDFTIALGHPDVVLTRAARSEGAPTVATRWLQRLLAVIGPDARKGLEARGRCYLDWARAIDTGAAQPREKRPEPRPPLVARPKQASVTEIERWIRDPYAIYARRILRLDPLEPIGAAPDYADRGNVIHGALDAFSESWHGPFDEMAVAALLAIGERHFEPLRAYPEVHALWWPRFRRMARFVVLDFEAGRDAARNSELKGKLAIPIDGEDFTLSGRADRLDVFRDGTLSVVDFKTGAAPSDRQIAALVAPQLPLEALMAEAGAFGEDLAMPASELVHVVLKGLDGADDIRRFTGHAERDGPVKTLPEVVVEAGARLVALVRAYRDPAMPYRSRARPLREREFTGDYDHLARVREWSVGGDEEGEA